MGRPTKRTPERERIILDAILAGNSRKVAAALAGIGERTLYDWEERFPQFSQALEKAEAEAETAMVQIVRGAAVDSWTAAAWWLERRRNETWGRKETLRQEHSGTVGVEIEERATEFDRRIAGVLAANGAGTAARGGSE